MSASLLIKLTDLVFDVSVDDDLTNVIDGVGEAISIAIYSPAAAPVGTIGVEVAPDSDSAAADFRPLFSNGSAVTLPQNSCTVITASGYSKLRLTSSGTESADLTYVVRAQTRT